MIVHGTSSIGRGCGVYGDIAIYSVPWLGSLFSPASTAQVRDRHVNAHHHIYLPVRLTLGNKSATRSSDNTAVSPRK